MSEQSDAEYLRETAAMMREAADAATPGSWRSSHREHGRDYIDEDWSLAAADWLEDAADALDRGWAQPHALAVARTWRGEDQ